MTVNSAPEIWRTALGVLKIQVSSVAFETWLRGTTGDSRSPGSFTVSVPNVFVADWLDKRMRSLIERTLSVILKRHTAVQFAIRPSDESPIAESDSGRPARVQPTQPPPVDRPASRPTRTTAPPGRSASPNPPRVLGQRPDPEMTFATFVPGSANKFAYAAAAKVADHPGRSYNPLFVSGPPGLGKTHLLHAVANAAQAREQTTLLVTAEEFVTEFVSSAREKRAGLFEKRYRSPDVLIIEDLQYLCGKQRSEESFFNTCAVLLRESRQVVLSADRPLEELPFTHRKLASRFEAGLGVAVSPPDHPSRLAILGFKATRSAITVADEIVQFIAARPSTSIRQMESELAKVTALSTLTNQALTLELATHALESGVSSSAGGHGHLPASLIHATASFYQLSPAVLAGPSRERTIVHARHVAMFLLRKHTPLSLKQVGRLIGNRDHTTVQHGVSKIHRLSTDDPSLAADLESIPHATPLLPAR
jgi:chromosomal replication initiator protein